MAIFVAPVLDLDHAANAARAALHVVASVMQAKTDADRRGVPGYAVKIGLNSGPAVVGNIGAPKRYNYTDVGETVNIAAQLESVPEDYGCRIVVGPNTAAAIGDRFVICELDWIKVKGKDTAFSVYQLIGKKSTVKPSSLVWRNTRLGWDAIAPATLPPPKSSGAARRSILIQALPQPRRRWSWPAGAQV